MTVEAVTYISDLNITYPAAGDSLVEGDDHLRNLKIGIKNTFPNISGAVTPTHTVLNYVTGVTSAIQTQLDAKSALTDRGLVLIATASASASATIDFTSGINSTYEEYELHIINAVPSVNLDTPWLRTDSNAGASFDTAGGDYSWNRIHAITTTVTSASAAASTATKIELSGVAVSNAASGGGFSAVVKFFDPAGTASFKRFNWQGGSLSVAGVNDQNSDSVIIGTGTRYNVAAIDAIRFMFSTGNITSGKFKLYGVKK